MDNKLRKEQFKARFEEYYSMLCRIAYQYISDQDECEDLVQETFINIWNKGKDNLPAKEFGAYIVTSVKNNCISYLRQKRLDTIPMEDYHSSLCIMSSDSDPGDESSPDVDEILQNILAILPPKCRQIFNMSKLKGMKYKEIARELEISEKTVENQMGKAMKLLREYVVTNPIILSVIIFLLLLVNNQ